MCVCYFIVVQKFLVDSQLFSDISKKKQKKLFYLKKKKKKKHCFISPTKKNMFLQH